LSQKEASKEAIPEKAEAEAQTDIGAEYFVDAGKGSQMSMASSKKKGHLNQDSSTAFGTIQPNHGASLMVDIDGGLVHN
jgi:hypothetical protein